MAIFSSRCSLLLLTCFIISLSQISTSEQEPSVTLLDVKSVLTSLRKQELQLQGDELVDEEEVPELHHVIHRSSLQQKSRSHRDVVKERLRRDTARLRSIAQRLDMSLNGVKHRDLRQPVVAQGSWNVSKAGSGSSDVTSGLVYGSGEYFVRLGVGTPSKPMFLVMDTGSDVPWIQCSPCKSCYQQSDPVFDPQGSSTFRRLTCSSSQCQQLDVKSCSSATTPNTCMYQVSYGDGSFTVGDLVSDSFSLRSGSGSSPSFTFGCGHDNEGLFVGAAGLLGLGAGKLSFPSQLPGTRKFSYCLVTRDNGVRASSALLLGDNAIPPSANFVYTTLLRNPRLDTFYYAGLTGVSVGGSLLSIPAGTFRLSSVTGRGGVIIDSGTSVTRMPTAAYNAMRDAFRAGTTGLTVAPGFSLFDTCYDLSGMTSVEVPTVVFHYEGGGRVQLPAGNYMVPVDSSGTFCLAFAKTGLQLSIIGNIQQQTMRVAVDMEKGRIGFAQKQCV